MTPGPRWIISGWLDLLLLAFPWVPIYLSAVWAIGTDRIAYPIEQEPRLFLLTLFALNFMHRNYTNLLVFGDRRVFREHAIH